ncbi:hypothetical protein CTA1_4065 [Colletotrichum tanaceti]|uniref:Uncharacterized protein n=1 Tax=Colletotrichum tanaceti TaxID=1306861 RepID=A0A4U6X2P7_9PEZI|nr:hypothetical protein CTA1_4065 [Colletotrichum tanaceti]
MVLPRLADILAGEGVGVYTTVALEGEGGGGGGVIGGDATTRFFAPSARRQLFEVGSCRDSGGT